jgi:hypothetical protein
MKLTVLYEEFAELWVKACKLDGVDPTTAAAELSDDNPFRSRLASLNQDIHQYEHMLRYLHSMKPLRDAQITGAKL